MNNLTVPEIFRQLPIPMPPALPKVVGVTGDKRFFRLNYEGSKAF
jgi:hypothetical protein